ncbi:DUF4352 domain-containing protein [Lactovum miscens]|uniref:DUF4352 domain-containing protein n=1 Tax=Lactovum miscens TaxID=190387 RepID=A0A841C8M4_9LACT|nr:DUF4352 domain-containing protein [Lactovum miscens]MBB5887749.1 hypothetical protein [Lactovum miscens]
MQANTIKLIISLNKTILGDWLVKKFLLIAVAMMSIGVLSACGNSSASSSSNTSKSTSSHDSNYYYNQEKDSLKNLKTLVENGALSNSDAKQDFEKEQATDAKNGYASSLKWTDVSTDGDTSSSDSSSNSNIGTIGTTFKDSSDVSYTVTAITPNSPNVSLEDANSGETALEVDVTVVNNGSSVADFNATRFDAYDSQGNTLNLDSATYGNDVPDTIPPTITAKIEIFFDNSGTGPYKITLNNVVWSSQ